MGAEQHPHFDSASSFFVGNWLVDPDSSRIRYENEESKLEPKVMALLLCLAKQHGKVISRETLEQVLWPNMVVGYDALTSTVIKLRKAFGDNSRQPVFIETIPKKGYRLIARVSEISDRESTVPVHQVKLKQPRYIKLFLGSMIALLISGLAWYYSYMTPENTFVFQKPSLVILPFKNLSQQTEQKYLSHGIAEDIMTELSRYSGLLVIARQSAFNYSNSDTQLHELQKSLKIHYALEGSLQQTNDHIRINARLFDLTSNRLIWARKFERKIEETFHLQDEIVKDILESLSIKLTQEEQKWGARINTTSIAAYNIYLNARDKYTHQTEQSILQAQEELYNALKIDDKFARAHSLLALTYIDQYRFGWSKNTEFSIQQSVQHAQKAIKLEHQLPVAHWVLGYVKLFASQNPSAAIESVKTALKFNPNYADGYALLAMANIYTGQPELAKEYIKNAMILNPHYPSQYLSILGYSEYFLEDYNEAKIHLEKSVLKNPSRIPPHVFLAATYSRLNQIEDANWQLDNLKNIDTQFDVDKWIERQPYLNTQISDRLIMPLKIEVN